MLWLWSACAHAINPADGLDNELGQGALSYSERTKLLDAVLGIVAMSKLPCSPCR